MPTTARRHTAEHARILLANGTPSPDAPDISPADRHRIRTGRFQARRGVFECWNVRAQDTGAFLAAVGFTAAGVLRVNAAGGSDTIELHPHA